MEGKARFIYSIVITAIIGFITSVIVTWANVGFAADVIRRGLSACPIG